jgi:hypothetical protein
MIAVMKNTEWLVISVLLALTVMPTPVHAFEAGADGWLAGITVLTNWVSLVANTVVVAKQDGSEAMGWIGIASGGGAIIVGSVVGDNGWIDITTGVAGIAMGAWSVALARRRPREGSTHRLEIGPVIARRIDGAAEACLSMTLRF